VTAPLPRSGLLFGAVGILVFSLTLPMTRIALRGFDPLVVCFARASLAAVAAAIFLRLSGAAVPSRDQARRLLIVMAGVVIGFPLFTSLALLDSGAAHGAVIVAVLPAVTAAFAVLRAGERPGPMFWTAAALGLLFVAGFAIAEAGGAPSGADLLELCAVLCAGLGYAEGGALAREIGGPRTISWALVLGAPLTVPLAAIAVLLDGGLDPHLGPDLALAYLSLGSMFLGFFAWYAGLARGGVAKVGQIQLLQPLLTVGWSAVLLSERVTPATLVVALGVLVSVALTQRARVVGVPVGGSGTLRPRRLSRGRRSRRSLRRSPCRRLRRRRST